MFRTPPGLSRQSTKQSRSCQMLVLVLQSCHAEYHLSPKLSILSRSSIEGQIPERITCFHHQETTSDGTVRGIAPEGATFAAKGRWSAMAHATMMKRSGGKRNSATRFPISTCVSSPAWIQARLKGPLDQECCGSDHVICWHMNDITMSYFQIFTPSMGGCHIHSLPV